MVCFAPLRGVRTPHGELLFGHTESSSGVVDAQNFVFSCGRCVGCCLRRSRDLAVRCVHESRSVSSTSCHFLTFTHSDASLPRLPDGRPTLDKTLMPAMFKRLRKNTGQTGIKFLQVGEYGTKTLRPHYHAVVFGLELPDLKPYKPGRFGHQLYNSETLQRAWQDRGHVVVGGFSFDTAQYCARYMLDKQLHADYTSTEVVDWTTGEILSPQVEHITMSRGGRGGHGLAYNFFKAYHRSFFSLGAVVVSNKQLPVPRYYIDKLREAAEAGCLDSEELLNKYLVLIKEKYASTDWLDDGQLLLAKQAKEAYIKAHVRDVVSLAIT